MEGINMRKTGKNVLSLLLVFVLLAGTCVSAFGAKADTVKHYDVYTCLGDSHAAGYGTTGYIYSKIPAPNAYHSLVANAVGAQLNDYGVGGYRTHEVSYMLDPNYQMDWDYAPVSNADVFRDQLDEYREAYRQAVVDADLITVQLGSNDFSAFYGNAIMELYLPIEELDTLKAKFNGDNAFDKLVCTIIGYADQAVKIMNFAVATVKHSAKVLQNYGPDFDEMMGNIYRLNPDATVVVIGNYNSLNQAYVEVGGTKLYVGKLFDVVFGSMNLWLKYGSKYVGKYIYVDVFDMQFFPLNLSDNEFADSDKLYAAVHQHDEGHAEVARRILAALPTE